MKSIDIIKSFEGASIGDYSIEGNRIYASFRNEPIVKKDGFSHDYNWHFVFGLKNNSEEIQDVEVFINCDSKNGLEYQAHIFAQQTIDKEFEIFTQIEAKTDTYKKYYLKICLAGKEKLYLSNTYFRSLELIQSNFSQVVEAHNCQKEIYGQSVEGRDLEAIIFSKGDISEDQKPSVVITSGFHPMEADTFATEAIKEYLGTEEGNNFLQSFRFILIPVVNPDGFAHGYNGCNAKGINLYWEFREKDKKNTPEAYYLWQYLLKIHPSVYVDFHSYTFQLHRKKASPYLKPLFFYRGEEVKKLVSSINKELISLHKGHRMAGHLTYTPSSLPYKLTQKFNTITYAKYHLHILDGKETLKKNAVDIVKIISNQMMKNSFFDKNNVLSIPYGSVRGNIKDFIKKRINILWTFKIKVLIKKILKNAPSIFIYWLSICWIG